MLENNHRDRGLVVVLSGFSGAGKGTIMKHLLRKYEGQYHLSISATTRAKRQGEEEGREYFFKTREEFDQMIEAGEFLEYATFNGNSYGTPRGYVEQLITEGKDVILEIEVQGALQVRKIFPDALLLFVRIRTAVPVSFPSGNGKKLYEKNALRRLNHRPQPKPRRFGGLPMKKAALSDGWKYNLV